MLSEAETVYTPGVLTVGDCDKNVKEAGPVQVYEYGGFPPAGVAVNVVLVGPPEHVEGFIGVIGTLKGGYA